MSYQTIVDMGNNTLKSLNNPFPKEVERYFFQFIQNKEYSRVGLFAYLKGVIEPVYSISKPLRVFGDTKETAAKTVNRMVELGTSEGALFEMKSKINGTQMKFEPSVDSSLNAFHFHP